MKTFKSLLAAVVVMAVAVVSGTQSASAGSPFRFGLKAGVAINELKFNEDAFSSSNRAGFTGGVTAQFIAPILNIGCDASVMYTRRSSSIDAVYDEDGSVLSEAMNKNSDYIEVPINFRWNISLPLVGSFVTPFLATGPDFSFLLSNKSIKGSVDETVNAWKNKSFDFAWNFGVGLKFVDRVEVSAMYGLGITSNASSDQALYGSKLTDGKNRVWTITAAYLF
jgi:hypothetical protein